MRRFVQVHKLLLMVLAALIVSVGLAACGSSDNKDSANVKGEGISSGTGDRAATAKKEGTAAGEAAGAPVKLEKKTIGIINFIGGLESSDRLVKTAQKAGNTLGYANIVCDGKGTPTLFVTCGNSLLDQGVDAIVQVAIEPGIIQPVLDKANKQGVPVIQIGGGSVPTGDMDGNYGPDETKAGQLLTDYIMPKLTALDGNPGTIIHDFPAAWASKRTDTYRAAIKAQDKVKLLANTITDGTKLVEFTKKTVTDQITQYPDAKAYWFAYDTTGAVGGQVIASKYPGKKFPDKPMVATFHADLGTLALMKTGVVDVISEANYDAASWIALDQLAGFFSRKTPISKDNQPIYPGVGDLFSYQIVTQANMPPAGQYFPPKVDVVTYFNSKWAAEYEGVPAS